MGQQLNKIVKRRRRKLYVARKKALAKAGLSRKPLVREPKAAKKTVKKAAPKKDKAPAKAKAAPAAEAVIAPVVAETAAPAVEETAPVVEETAAPEAPAAEEKSAE
ncbi:hypothetical protein WJU23_06290 [Prosthecobacter sp. SYSU 5D2]|uniref:hypothetical protein n=1 Tax=Prosthecobacter sp. SYSU 5D2 TaxID=3134134 RepID=UPI0031FF3472